VAVAWARPESGFTLPFEALLIEFATAMPVARDRGDDQGTRHPDRAGALEHHVATESGKLSSPMSGGSGWTRHRSARAGTT